MSRLFFQISRSTGVLCMTLMLISFPAAAQDTTTTSNTTSTTETAAPLSDSMRAYLQLQEQIHATQLAIEENREAAQAAAELNAISLSNRLQAIEQSLIAQRTNELEAMQSTNRLMLFVLGLLAAVGFAAVLLTAYFQWRAIHRLGEMAVSLPRSNGLAALPEVTALDERQLGNGAVEQSNTRLLGVIERLEKRIAELEHAAPPSLPAPSALPTERLAPSPQASADAAVTDKTTQATFLLGKGQSLLYLDQAEEAIACFNEVLALDPTHTEALVKKGAALEKLNRLQEAIECYDQAIAADGTMTVAYLYKGGLCNRMERFTEAMECYEQALRSQEKRRAA